MTDTDYHQKDLEHPAPEAPTEGPTRPRSSHAAELRSAAWVTPDAFDILVTDKVTERAGRATTTQEYVKRRTEIDVTGGGDIIIEDLIEDEQVVVTITHQGLIKRTSLTEYRAQGRGGVGQRGSGMRDEDYIEHLFVSSNHDYLLFFTDHGLCYWLRVFEIPEGTRTGKGRSIRNLIQIDPEDRVRTVLAVRKAQFMDDEFLNTHYVMMATRQGQVKKTALEAFSRPRADGIIAISTIGWLANKYDVIIPEQELNHLTHAETLEFLQLCRPALKDNGLMIVYGLNGANPLVGSENLAHNIDHFYTMTEYSLNQMLEYAGFRNIRMHPLKLYVFWKNPLNYVGLAVTGFFHVCMRVIFILYGKKVKILTKKIMATCNK